MVFGRPNGSPMPDSSAQWHSSMPQLPKNDKKRNIGEFGTDVVDASEADIPRPDKKRRKKKHARDEPVFFVEGPSTTLDVPTKWFVDAQSGDQSKQSKNSKNVRQTAVTQELQPPTMPFQTTAETEIDFSSILNDEAAADFNFMGASPMMARNEFNPQLNSNEDILKIFQELDLSRLSGVLRGLDIPPAMADFGTGENAPLGPLPSSSYQNDISQGNTIRASSKNTTSPRSAPSQHSNPPKNKAQKNTQTAVEPVNVNISNVGQPISQTVPIPPEHAEMLAKRWLSSAQLKELVESDGLVYKKGKFSAMEEQILKTALDNYRSAHNITNEQLLDVIFAGRRVELHNMFWSEMATSVPGRPIAAVYHHVQRTYHPMKCQGKWTAAEDAAVIKGVADLGNAWSKISERVGRTAVDCRDRWRNHLLNRAERRTGKWTKEEEEELTRIILELTSEKDHNTDNDIFWTTVSQRMGNTRGRQQCRIKWLDALCPAVKNGGDAPRWTKHDAHILVQKVANLTVRDDREIDWKTLSDANWNVWSAHLLQRRFRTLKHSIKGYEKMTFKEIMEILLQRNTKPVESSKKARGVTAIRKPKSAITIEESDIDEDGDVVRARAMLTTGS